MKRIGLALGGGGVRGLAHVMVLEALDQMGCRPSVIAGTSMGAIIGAMYASGMSGADIRSMLREQTVARYHGWKDVISKRGEIIKLLRALAPDRPRGGLLTPDKFMHLLLHQIRRSRFEDLDLPLIVTASDFWTAEEVVFSSGDLLPALGATMAVPGVFAPVQVGDRLLVDGAVVSLVPYFHILDRCDISIAVNVAGVRVPESRRPIAIETVFGAVDIMQQAALAERMKQRAPSIYVRPDIRGVRMFDLRKVGDVFRQSEPAVAAMRAQLERLLS